MTDPDYEFCKRMFNTLGDQISEVDHASTKRDKESADLMFRIITEKCRALLILQFLTAIMVVGLMLFLGTIP